MCVCVCVRYKVLMFNDRLVLVVVSENVLPVLGLSGQSFSEK